LNTKGIEQNVTLPVGHVVLEAVENKDALDKRFIKDNGIGDKIALDGQVHLLLAIWYVQFVEDEGGKQKIYEWSEGGINGLGSE
ncbi:hypothetical protein FO495_29715, partial [Bacillus tropicus]|nr:hypothetical protein [Bacillus tropicus]